MSPTPAHSPPNLSELCQHLRIHDRERLIHLLHLPADWQALLAISLCFHHEITEIRGKVREEMIA